MEVSKHEVEYLARQRFQAESRVVTRTIKFYEVIEPWYFLSIDGRIIGARRSLAELPALIERGPAMEVLDARTVRPKPGTNPHRVLEDPRALVPG
jgi:hypothetical protein